MGSGLGDPPAATLRAPAESAGSRHVSTCRRVRESCGAPSQAESSSKVSDAGRDEAAVRPVTRLPRRWPWVRSPALHGLESGTGPSSILLGRRHGGRERGVADGRDPAGPLPAASHERARAERPPADAREPRPLRRFIRSLQARRTDDVGLSIVADKLRGRAPSFGNRGQRDPSFTWHKFCRKLDNLPI